MYIRRDMEPQSARKVTHVGAKATLAENETLVDVSGFIRGPVHICHLIPARLYKGTFQAGMKHYYSEP